MALLNFRKPDPRGMAGPDPKVVALMQGYSIEVMPRTARKIDDFRALLPAGTRVYVAHIEGTPIDEMIDTARRLTDDGFCAMPHIVARNIPSRAALAEWISRYRNEAGVRQALLLAGGAKVPHGPFDSSLQMMETGLFDKAGFDRLHVAGHPEGNRDIDPDGGHANVEAALRWKQAFSERSDAEMAIVTQFVFEAQPIIDWADAIRAAGIHMPVHVGLAGPAKLQTLIKYAIACGVGPSLSVLQKRAMDVTKLLLPYEPADVASALAAHKAAHPDSNIALVHMFPLGGIGPAADWALDNSGAEAQARMKGGVA
ncbi:MAG: 5,10-methylenetetrahydrofolate reductase [Rhodobacteraceae bacterium]|nr:5,10-methylenetetrahydrofolate reductase [Paracoccaceae bacterium]